MTINTKCPMKWLFVDLETSNIWHHNEIGSRVWRWRHATEIELKELRRMAIRMLRVKKERK